MQSTATLLSVRPWVVIASLVVACNPPPPAHVTVESTADAEAPEAEPSAAPLDQQAKACLESAACTAQEVSQLYHRALESKLDVSCGVFATDGPVPDGAAERQCLERVVAKNDCSDGGSPSLAVLELAAALVDQAQPDLRRARALLAPCYQDAAVQTVLEHAKRKEHDASTPAIASCDALATTTLAQVACMSEHLEGEHAWLWMARKHYDARALPLFDAAAKAHDAYAEAVGRVVYEQYAGGTMRDPAMRSAMVRVLKRRHARLAALPHVTTQSAPLAQVEQQISIDRGTALRHTPELKAQIDAADAAFDAFRRAEVAFHAQIPGASTTLDVTLALEGLEDVDALLTP